MTKAQQEHDNLFDIMQLIEASTTKKPTNEELGIVIKPETARIKKALATPDKIDSLLTKHIERYLNIEGSKHYFREYALRKLINETSGGTVYKNHIAYEEKTLSRLHLAILKHTELIFLSRRLSPHMKKIIQAHHFWSNLTDKEKRERCCSIMISEDSHVPTFIDISFFYRKTRLSTKDMEDYDCIEEANEAYFSECCFMGQEAELPGSVDSQLTVEEVILAITDHIAARDLDLSMADSQATTELRDFILKRIEIKQQRNRKRISSFIDGLTITTLLNRARATPGQGYPKGDPHKPVRLSVAEFPLFMMDIVLNGVLPTRKRNQLLKRPESEQRAYLKYHIQALTLPRAIKTLSHDGLKKIGYQLPFIINLTDFIFEIRKKIRSEAMLNETELSKLNTVITPALKRFRSMSERDREMFTALERSRFMDLFNITKERYRHLDCVPVERLEKLRTSRFFADLYMMANDTGIRISRLRNLVKKVYLHYGKSSDIDRENGTYNRITHDILTNYEPNFITFLKGWDQHPRFHPVINRIIDLLISQLGGAQGEINKAFAYWGQLPTLVGKERLLLNGQPRNMDEVFYLIKTDPVYIKKATPLLNNLPASIVGQEHLHQYVSNSVGNKAFYDYLCKIVKTRHELEQKYMPVLPALTQPKQMTLGGLFFDLLPYDDLLGSLGVATQGVCIRFLGEHHLQHQTAAVANFIIRDEYKVWLWGLLIRAQNTETPTYILNNLQGAFPSRYSKHKEQIRDAIRSFLSEIGEIYSLDFYFNALQLLDEKEKKPRQSGHIIVPKMRLDVRGETIKDNLFNKPNLIDFMQVDLSSLYKINGQSKRFLQKKDDTDNSTVL